MVKKREITANLEHAKRQFHQWHYREVMTIREVKEKMDELSRHLRRISHYDFEASEGAWKYRQREWNKAWKIRKNQRGLHQPTPYDVSNLPLWQTEKGDVGNWRIAVTEGNDEPGHSSSLTSLAIQTPQEKNRGFGFWNPRKTDGMERMQNDVYSQRSQASSISSPSTHNTLNPPNTEFRQPEDIYPTSAEIDEWTDSITAPYIGIHPPILPYDEQLPNAQYQSPGYHEPYLYTPTTMMTVPTASSMPTTNAVCAPKPCSALINGPAAQISFTSTPITFPIIASNNATYPQTFHVHEQDPPYGCPRTSTVSAQSPSLSPSSTNQTQQFYDQDWLSQRPR